MARIDQCFTSVSSTLKTVTVMLIALTVLTGCAGMGQYKNPAEMTPTERAYLAMKVYDNAFANYNAQFSATTQPMSQAMADYFVAYKKVMTLAHPTITIYKNLVAAGTVPSIEQEQEILKIIYQLQAFLIKEVTK